MTHTSVEPGGQRRRRDRALLGYYGVFGGLLLLILLVSLGMWSSSHFDASQSAAIAELVALITVVAWVIFILRVATRPVRSTRSAVGWLTLFLVLEVTWMIGGGEILGFNGSYGPGPAPLNAAVFAVVSVALVVAILPAGYRIRNRRPARDRIVDGREITQRPADSS